LHNTTSNGDSESSSSSKPKLIKIGDNDNGIPIDLLSIPVHYREDLEYVMIPYGLILDRTEALATQIFNDFGNEPLICLCVLKGGYRFFSDLTERIQSRNRTSGSKSLPMMLDFIRIKSYHVSYFLNHTEMK
jgi:hypoxanthine phosphoribosyltransferase